MTIAIYNYYVETAIGERVANLQWQNFTHYWSRKE